MITNGPCLTIIGMGNVLAADDGVGVRVVRELEDRKLPPSVHLELVPAPGPELVDRLGSESEIWFVDAARVPEAEPGTIIHQVIAADDAPLIAAHHLVSTHGFSLAELIRLAEALNRKKALIHLWAIVGERFEASDGLSPVVEQAARELVCQMLEELERRGSAVAGQTL